MELNLSSTIHLTGQPEVTLGFDKKLTIGFELNLSSTVPLINSPSISTTNRRENKTQQISRTKRGNFYLNVLGVHIILYPSNKTYWTARNYPMHQKKRGNWMLNLLCLQHSSSSGQALFEKLASLLSLPMQQSNLLSWDPSMPPTQSQQPQQLAAIPSGRYAHRPTFHYDDNKFSNLQKLRTAFHLKKNHFLNKKLAEVKMY